MGQCDQCIKKGIKTRRLELGGGSGIELCNPCLRKEIAWRKLKNKELQKRWKGKAPKSVLFRTKYKFP